MNAYYAQDRIEAQDWTRHYQKIEREDRESNLAEDIEKGLLQRHFEAVCIEQLQRRGVSVHAISLAFDDDVDFQERMAEHISYMAGVIAKHQIDIEEAQ